MYCLFCDWNEKKNQVLFEDENIVVFVASLAFTKGHLLVCPKSHIESIFDASNDLKKDFFMTSIRMGQLLEKLDIKAFILSLNENVYSVEPEVETHVKHIHMHVIPRRKNEEAFVTERLNLTKEEVDEIIKTLSS